MTTLSIIIVNYRSWEHLEENLKFLEQSSDENEVPQIYFEIIVVDNDSNDGRVDTFKSKFPAIRLISLKSNFGYSHGCNVGAKEAAGDWLLFMNPDVTADWKNLHGLLKAAQTHPQWAILTAPQYTSVNGRMHRAFAPFTSLLTYSPTCRALLRILIPKHFPEPRRDPSKITSILEVDWVSGSLLLISKVNFWQLGGWDEDFFLYREDEDICRRARKAQMKVGFFPGAKFIHTHAASTRSSAEIRVLTKSETHISTYLYLWKHERNWSGNLLRSLMRWKNSLVFPVYSLFSILTFRKVGVFELKRGIQARLFDYFQRAESTGNYLSDKSINYINHSK